MATVRKASVAVGFLAVTVPLLYYSEMEKPIKPALVHRWDSAFFLFIAMVLSESAMTLTRRQYKLSVRFRDDARTANFFSTSADAEPAGKVEVMKALFAAFLHRF